MDFSYRLMIKALDGAAIQTSFWLREDPIAVPSKLRVLPGQYLRQGLCYRLDRQDGWLDESQVALLVHEASPSFEAFFEIHAILFY